MDKDSLEYILNVSQNIKPEYVSRYKSAFQKCQAETLKEEGCLVYELFSSETDSTRFHLYERWTNRTMQAAHTRTSHFKEFMDATQGISESNKVITDSYIIPD